MRIDSKRRQQMHGHRVAQPGTEHDDVAVREVDELQDAVHHRVAERDERIQTADRQRGHQSLSEVGHVKEQGGSELLASEQIDNHPRGLGLLE